MKIKASEQLKQLQTKKAKLEVQCENLLVELKNVQKNYSKAQSELLNVISEIEKLKESCNKDNEIIVTEHAILRYLERVNGIDIEKIRINLLPDDVKSQILTLGDGKYPVNKEYKLIVKNNSIVSNEQT